MPSEVSRKSEQTRMAVDIIQASHTVEGMSYIHTVSTQ